VDFILGDGEVAVEVKVSQDIAPSELKGIQAFMEEHPAAKAIVVANVDRPRLIKVDHGDITILPIDLLLQKLWGREIMG
jgi:hypothetical protein